MSFVYYGGNDFGDGELTKSIVSAKSMESEVNKLRVRL